MSDYKFPREILAKALANWKAPQDLPEIFHEALDEERKKLHKDIKDDWELNLPLDHMFDNIKLSYDECLERVILSEYCHKKSLGWDTYIQLRDHILGDIVIRKNSAQYLLI